MSLIKVSIDNQQEPAQVFLLDVPAQDAESTQEAERPEASWVSVVQAAQDGLTVVPLAQFVGEHGLWLTADDGIEELGVALGQHTPSVIVVYVADFKDGRVFSLVRQSRHLGFDGEILVIGEFGLDQASYFKNSGVTGFLVHQERLDTLTKTLNDLASAHKGISAGALPLFR